MSGDKPGLEDAMKAILCDPKVACRFTLRPKFRFKLNKLEMAKIALRGKSLLRDSKDGHAIEHCRQMFWVVS